MKRLKSLTASRTRTQVRSVMKVHEKLNNSFDTLPRYRPETAMKKPKVDKYSLSNLRSFSRASKN